MIPEPNAHHRLDSSHNHPANRSITGPTDFSDPNAGVRFGEGETTVPDKPTDTIAWIGREDDREFSEPYFFCRNFARQIAVRESIDHLLAHPPTSVDRIVVCKRSRTPQPQNWCQAVKLFPHSRAHVIYGAECEGEARTGKPWTSSQSFAWHAWNQEIPFWFCSRNRTNRVTSSRQVVVGVTRSIDLADALQTIISSAGHTAYWTNSPTSSAIRNVDIVIWDDTAAPATDRSQWQERLAWFDIPPASGRPKPRHIWCAGFPRYDEWLEAKRGGCDHLVSKPCGEAVFRFLIDPNERESLTQNRTYVKPLAAVTANPIG